MARYASKGRHDSLTDKGSAPDAYRFQRKRHGRRAVLPGGLSRQERRHHGWGYLKRRALMENY